MNLKSTPWHSKQTQLEKFSSHLKDFNVKKDDFLLLFEDFISKSNNFFLECSCKLVNGEASGSRFALLYKDKNHLENIKKAFMFFSDLQKKDIILNFDLVKELDLSNIAQNKTQGVGLGIDLREKKDNSRAKFWIATENNYYNLFNRGLELYGESQIISELIHKNELLLGFDFYFGGKTKMKIYPHFYDYELKNKVIHNRLKSTFSPRIMELISHCYMLYVSFEGKEHLRVLHFNPHDLNALTKAINSSHLDSLIDKISFPYSNCIVTLVEKEILNNDIRTINIYY